MIRDYTPLIVAQKRRLEDIWPKIVKRLRADWPQEFPKTLEEYDVVLKGHYNQEYGSGFALARDLNKMKSALRIIDALLEKNGGTVE